MWNKSDIPNIKNTAVPEFRSMLHAIHKLFSSNLKAVFVHGSLFYDTLYSYSDYDVVIILNQLDKTVLERDKYANKLKKMLKEEWNKHPFSFDLCTLKELNKSAKAGHPFVRSILYQGFPIYDISGLFVQMRSVMKTTISNKLADQMYRNLIFLSQRHYQIATILFKAGEKQFAIREISSAIVLLMRAYLIKQKIDIYKGEIYQFFVKEFGDNFSKECLNFIWDFGLHGNQIGYRLIEPHIDIPLQNSSEIYQLIDKIDIIPQLFMIYNKIGEILTKKKNIFSQ